MWPLLHTFQWHVDSVEEWTYVYTVLVMPDLAAARCKTREDKARSLWRPCRLYDCDFNNQLDLGIPVTCGGPSSNGSGSSTPLTVFDIESIEELEGRRIAAGNHCFGCTAGAGSSCQGAVA